MDTRWLQAFIAVAEELHFGRAAAKLHMAQSPLSQIIRKLERALDTDLFTRNTRSVELTAAGMAFLPYAREVLDQLETGRQATHAVAGEVVGRVRLGYSGVLNHVVLPGLVRAVHQQLPQVRLELVGRVLTQDAIVQLEQGMLDVACVGLPIEATDLTTRLLLAEPLGAVLPENHPLAAETSVSVGQLRHEPFITTTTSGGSALLQTTMRQCADAGFRPSIVQEASDPYVVLLLVAGGVGVSLVTESIAPMMPPGAVYRPLSDASVKLEHGVAWSPRAPSPALHAVLELIDQAIV